MHVWQTHTHMHTLIYTNRRRDILVLVIIVVFVVAEQHLWVRKGEETAQSKTQGAKQQVTRAHTAWAREVLLLRMVRGTTEAPDSRRSNTSSRRPSRLRSLQLLGRSQASKIWCISPARSWGRRSLENFPALKSCGSVTASCRGSGLDSFSFFFGLFLLFGLFGDFLGLGFLGVFGGGFAWLQSEPDESEPEPSFSQPSSSHSVGMFSNLQRRISGGFVGRLHRNWLLTTLHILQSRPCTVRAFPIATTVQGTRGARTPQTLCSGLCHRWHSPAGPHSLHCGWLCTPGAFSLWMGRCGRRLPTPPCCSRRLPSGFPYVFSLKGG